MQTADACFRIPMVGMTRSLNLSVAAALIAERASAQRRRILGVPGDLDEATQLRLRARFYAVVGARRRGGAGAVSARRRGA